MAGTIDISDNVRTGSPVVPQIYAYTTPEIRRHDGWTKIGYTEQGIDIRIGQQTHTADVDYQFEWCGNAIYEDGSGEAFRDTDFHSYLMKLHIDRIPKTEWFHADSDTSHRYFYDFRENRGVAKTASAMPYSLRDEQQRAVEQTANYARIHPGGEFLWNAKPRFGKTLTSYDLCKNLDADKVLVVTDRPAIANSWYDDYVRFLGSESGYVFVSDTPALKDKPSVMSRADYRKFQLQHDGAKCIEFVSLQDLKGSMYFGGAYDKLEEVAHLSWDILIVDEAHEGVDTEKTDVAFNQITRDFTLHLSGTPFKAIASDKFPEDAIFNWTYADEQNAKVNWDNSDLENPYADLPKMNLFTYRMSNIVSEKASQGIEIDGETHEYTSDLNEFFSTDAQGHFRYNDDVDRFLDALATQKKFPFSTPKLRNELKHTFWMLDRVDSAKALARKLKKHPVFKDYEIVLAAGDGRLDEQDETEQSLNKVRKAIAEKDKTITLSVGQLTTGVTVPEWTAVLMLCNMKSPSLYMQSAFRAQNPCLFYDKNSKHYLRKQNAYIFDFDPARTLTIVDEFANDLYSGNGTSDGRKQNVRRLLNFLPVLGEDENGEMEELDAESVLSIPRAIRSHEVVRRGFMSDYLFQNISKVFHASGSVIDIIGALTPTEKPTRDLGSLGEDAEQADLDSDGNVALPDEKVIGTAADIFGDKLYELPEELDQQIDEASRRTMAADKKDEDSDLTELTKRLVAGLSEPLIKTAADHYGDDLKPAQRKKIEHHIHTNVGLEINRRIKDYQIQRTILDKQRDDALDQAETTAEADRIRTEHDDQLVKTRAALNIDLKKAADDAVKNAGETIVREVETAKREVTRTDLMEVVREHLRGFSRTIPSFLMAYGDENTKLDNFDSIIPADVFKEVTGITVDQFRLLRDGGEVNNEDGVPEHFEGKLFDPVVFDDSVDEFNKLKSKLANYFDETQTEDIFDYIPPQKTNQIFTPKKVVKHMVDLFEQENPGCFDDPDHTFADLYMKSGLFITEIVKRLYNNDSMKRLYPDGDERLRHIFEHQVYGIAPTEIIYRIATNYILGPNREIGKDYQTHFVMKDSAKLAQAGKLDEFVEKQFDTKNQAMVGKINQSSLSLT